MGDTGAACAKLRGCKGHAYLYFGGLHDKDYSILGSLLGSPYFGKLLKKLARIGNP